MQLNRLNLFCILPHRLLLGALAILTESATPYDDHCTVRLHGKAGVQMTEVLTALDGLGMPAAR